MKKKLIEFALRDKMSLFLLGIIVAVGAYLRFWGVFTNSFPFTYDTGRDLLAVRDIFLLGKVSLIGPTTGLPGLFYGPWWYYFLTIPYLVFGGSPQGITFFIGLTSIVGILIAFYIGKRISSSFVGLLFAGLFAFSPAVIGLTNQIWNPTLIPLSMMLVFLIIDELFEIQEKTRKRTVLFLLLGFSLGFIIDMEIVVGVLFTLGVLFSLVILNKVRISLFDFLGLMAGFLVIFSPRMFFELRHQFLMSNAVINSVMNFASNPEAGATSHTILYKLSLFLTQWTDSVAGGVSLLAYLLLAGMVTSFIKWNQFGRKEKFFIKIVSGTLGIFILGTFLFSHDVWPHYLVPVPVLMVFLFALSQSASNKGTTKKYVSLVAVFLLLFLIKPLDIYSQFTQPIWEGDVSVYRNQTAVVDYIYTQAGDKPFKYILYTTPIYDFTYKYHFVHYGPNTYGKTPDETNAKLLFLIIEPEKEHPFLRERWLEERKTDGKIIKQETLKGGVIVQTREI